MGVKDSFDVAGARTGAGSPEWLDEQHPAIQHAWAVQRLLDAGATAVGKTVCDEFFYSLSGITSHYGTPVNVRAPGRIPGGSSCGSAAATAGGACDIGLGTDTGGSIRVPSAFCGLYGLRPTHGRVPMDGCRPMAPSFDVAGWMADDAATLAAVGPVLLPAAGAVPADVVRVVVAEDAFAEADPEVAEAAERALEALPSPDRGTIAPEAGLDGWRGAFRVVQAYEVWQSYGEFVTRVRPALGPRRARADGRGRDGDRGRRRPRAPGGRRGRPPDPRDRPARHGDRAAHRSVRTTADRRRARRGGVVSHPDAAADLHRRPVGAAAGHRPRGACR